MYLILIGVEEIHRSYDVRVMPSRDSPKCFNCSPCRDISQNRTTVQVFCDEVRCKVVAVEIPGGLKVADLTAFQSTNFVTTSSSKSLRAMSGSLVDVPVESIGWSEACFSQKCKDIGLVLHDC